MSVVLETSVGDLTIDLLCEEAPRNCENFLGLCALKYYNNILIHRVERDFILLTGSTKETSSTATDPGPTAFSLVDREYHDCFRGEPESKLLKYIPDEISTSRKHEDIGVVGTANEAFGANGASFYITLGKNIHSLNRKHTIFGIVVEGLEILKKINMAIVDQKSVPLHPMRIRHTMVLENPFEETERWKRWINKIIPQDSPSPIENEEFEPLDSVEDEIRLLEKISQNEARSRAIALEILGDIPDADMKPPENVLFICKLNPYTEEEDLKTIFSQFGEVLNCEIIRDWKTGDSLQYGFIEYKHREDCEEAYFKMQDCLVDDRRIHVDFCQSVDSRYIAYRRQGNRGTRLDAIEANDTSKRSSEKEEKPLGKNRPPSASRPYAHRQRYPEQGDRGRGVKQRPMRSGSPQGTHSGSHTNHTDYDGKRRRRGP